MRVFISWIEKDNIVYFLTGDKLYRSERGKICREKSVCLADDMGHNIIQLFYDLEDGIKKECSDFSTPFNFPTSIGISLVNGSMSGFPFPTQLLNEYLVNEYNSKPNESHDYTWKLEVLSYNYWIKANPLRDIYNRHCEKFDNAYWNEHSISEDEYYTRIKPYQNIYLSKINPLREKLYIDRKKLYTDYCDAPKLINDKYWALIKDINNRSEAWKYI